MSRVKYNNSGSHVQHWSYQNSSAICCKAFALLQLWQSPSGHQEVILPEWCSECEEIGDRKIGDINTPQYCRRANKLDGFIYLSTNLSLSSCCFILFQSSLHPIIVGQYYGISLFIVTMHKRQFVELWSVLWYLQSGIMWLNGAKNCFRNLLLSGKQGC